MFPDQSGRYAGDAIFYRIHVLRHEKLKHLLQVTAYMYIWNMECMNDILGGVQLGSSTEVVVAWWGEHTHPLCRANPDMNTIVCNPEEEDTMVATQATGWIVYLLKRQKCCVADLFSPSGKGLTHTFSCNIHMYDSIFR